MTVTEISLSEFYNGCDYWPVNGDGLRPRELNIPETIPRRLKPEIVDEACRQAMNNRVVIELDRNSCHEFAPILLHESLFHFYKAFYNYLAARALYFSGMPHWINVTLYYAKFYLAKSITTLVGKQSYWITPIKRTIGVSNPYFMESIATAIHQNKKRAYRIQLSIEVDQNRGQIIFDRNSVHSHQDIWNDYISLPLERMGIESLTAAYQEFSSLTDERNEENYSFEGYMQLDFNLPIESFTSYFKQDYIKSTANQIYDFDSSPVLLAFSSHLRLYRKLEVKGLPVEQEKFAYMIKYCLPDSEAKEKLLMLCNENFPTHQLYSWDGDKFYDEQDRFL